MKSLARTKVTFSFVSLIWIITIAGSTQGQESIKLSGSVSDRLSAPIPGARISLYSLDRILQTTSDASGRFRFDSVPAGKYEFEVLAPGFKRNTQPLFVTDRMSQGKPMEFTFVMEIAPTGSPRVIIPASPLAAPAGSCGRPDLVTYYPRKTSADAPLSGFVEQHTKLRVGFATVRLFDATGVQIAQQQTNERGEFQFNQTAPGRYYLEVEHATYNKLQSGEFRIARENTTEMKMMLVPLGRFVVCQ